MGAHSLKVAAGLVLVFMDYPRGVQRTRKTLPSSPFFFVVISLATP